MSQQNIRMRRHLLPPESIVVLGVNLREDVVVVLRLLLLMLRLHLCRLRGVIVLVVRILRLIVARRLHIAGVVVVVWLLMLRVSEVLL